MPISSSVMQIKQPSLCGWFYSIYRISALPLVQGADKWGHPTALSEKLERQDGVAVRASVQSRGERSLTLHSASEACWVTLVMPSLTFLAGLL